jgi:hypothetical protein
MTCVDKSSPINNILSRSGHRNFKLYLLKKIAIIPPEPLSRFVVKLNEANIATRYPEDLDELQKNYTEKVVKDIILKSREVLTWIKERF